MITKLFIVTICTALTAVSLNASAALITSYDDNVTQDLHHEINLLMETHVDRSAIFDGKTSRNDDSILWHITIMLYNPPQNNTLHSWAAHHSRINAVPVPAAIWLFSFGLISLLGFIRKKS